MKVTGCQIYRAIVYCGRDEDYLLDSVDPDVAGSGGPEQNRRVEWSNERVLRLRKRVWTSRSPAGKDFEGHTIDSGRM